MWRRLHALHAQRQGIDAWVQIACPRLSIDWGHSFDRPLLTPYELEVALKTTEWCEVYPMDYCYAQNAGPLYCDLILDHHTVYTYRYDGLRG